MTKHLWYATFSKFGTAGIAKVKVLKETPKQYRVELADHEITNIGVSISYVPGVLNKEKSSVFQTEIQAIAWLISQHEQYVMEKEEKLVEIKDSLKELRDTFTVLLDEERAMA